MSDNARRLVQPTGVANLKALLLHINGGSHNPGMRLPALAAAQHVNEDDCFTMSAL
jgi:hypothetical protein